MELENSRNAKKKGNRVLKMDYKEFVDRVSRDLVQVLPDDMKKVIIFAEQVNKLQGRSYYGISVKPVDFSAGISLDLYPLFECMEEGEPYEHVLQQIGKFTVHAMKLLPKQEILEFMDFDSWKEKLTVQIVPVKGNEEILCTVPHMKKEDLAMVYRFMHVTSSNNVFSALITNDLLEGYHISAEELHEQAMANAVEKFPATIRNMRDIISEIANTRPDLDVEKQEERCLKMYVARCNNGVNGASCIFYPGFLKQTAKQLGGDFYILPCSIHEVIFVVDTDELDYRRLEDMVKEANETVIQSKDRLSDFVYHYDAKEDIFEKAETFAVRKEIGRNRI